MMFPIQVVACFLFALMLISACTTILTKRKANLINVASSWRTSTEFPHSGCEKDEEGDCWRWPDVHTTTPPEKFWSLCSLEQYILELAEILWKMQKNIVWNFYYKFMFILFEVYIMWQFLFIFNTFLKKKILFYRKIFTLTSSSVQASQRSLFLDLATLQTMSPSSWKTFSHPTAIIACGKPS